MYLALSIRSFFEALRCVRKASNRSDWSGCPPCSAHGIPNCAESNPTELRPGAVIKVQPFRCSTSHASHPSGHDSRLGRWFERSMVTLAGRGELLCQG